MNIGMANGFVLYDYFVDGQVDWILTNITTILAAIVMVISNPLIK